MADVQRLCGTTNDERRTTNPFLILLALLLSAVLPAAVAISGPTTLSGTVGIPLVAAVSASGGAPLTYDAITLPAGLSINHATGRISGTPTAAGITAVTVTADGGAAGSASATLTITIAAALGPAIINASEWAISDGSACSLQLVADATATGFTASGQPAGLSLSASGLLSGVASGAGLYNVSVSANGGNTITTLVLEVLPAQFGAPSFTIPRQPVAAIGAPFAAVVDASGATSFTATSLPAWLSLDASYGLLSGTPPAATASANLRLTASAGATAASTVLAIPVAVPGTSDPLPTSPAVVEATRFSGLGWKATASATATWSALGLPAGLAIDPASGQLTGTPSVAGTVSAVITATPTTPAQPVSTTIVLRVRPAVVGAPQLATLVPPVLTVGAPAAIAAILSSGAATSYAAVGASDFTIDSVGLLSGTPSAAGLRAVTLSASNASGTAVTTLLLQTGVRLAAAPLPSAPVSFRTTAGSRFAVSLIADSAVTTWSASGLPTGLAISPFTGRITGLTAAGTSNLFLSASDADGSNPTHGALRAVSAVSGAPVIADAGPWVVGAGQPLHLQLDATATPSWSVSGLPSGLTASASGLITGSASAVGDINVTLTASNAAGAASTTAVLVVEPAAVGTPVFSAVGELVGMVGTPFTGQLNASLAPIEYTVGNGPAWLVVVPATGVLSGTPTAVGTWLLSLTARNTIGTVRSLTMLRIVAAPTPPTPPTPSAPPLSNVSGGGCGAGAAGLLVGLLAMGLRRRRD